MSAQHAGIQIVAPPVVKADAASTSAMPEALDSLRAALGGSWWIVDTVAGESQAADRSANVNPSAADAGPLPAHWLALCGEVARRGRVEFIGDEEPLLAIAAPIADGGESRYVAVGMFLSMEAQSDRAAEPGAADCPVCGNSTPDRAASRRKAIDLLVRQFGWRLADAKHWFDRQIPWPADRLLAVAETVIARFAVERRIHTFKDEAGRMSAHLTDLYEEISLWHRLTRHLRISENEEQLGRMALEWLSAAVPAEALVLQLLCESDAGARQLCAAPAFLTHGAYPLDADSFGRMIRTLGLDRDVQTAIVNPPSSATRLRDFPGVRQLIVVPLAAGENLIGWLAAVNHRKGDEFGSPEASLLASVAAILGIHAGNLALYRQQAEMLSGIVRALTSAIDAKDPYTCGHSDRVARISVALAAELGCDRKQLETLYLSGLLHDIGKIGINDSVLRKPGKLSDIEYEHIKLHPEIGYRILHDLKQLGEVLPVVRHHHEAWDGRGYPSGLSGEEIPQMARIVAVADAFDAMSSDRPYRKGMDDERLDEVLRDGAGKQWDANVVDAFFRIRAKIREISSREAHVETVHEELARMT